MKRATFNPNARTLRNLVLLKAKPVRNPGAFSVKKVLITDKSKFHCDHGYKKYVSFLFQIKLFVIHFIKVATQTDKT